MLEINGKYSIHSHFQEVENANLFLEVNLKYGYFYLYCKRRKRMILK